MRVGLRPRDQALLAQLADHGLLGLADRHPHEPLGGLIGDPPVLADHADLRQAVAAADLEVVGIVAGGDLERPGPELRLDVVVGDDLQAAPHDREDRRLADQPAVPLIVWMDSDRGVGEHRLRAGPWRSSRRPTPTPSG